MELQDLGQFKVIDDISVLHPGMIVQIKLQNKWLWITWGEGMFVDGTQLPERFLKTHFINY